MQVMRCDDPAEYYNLLRDHPDEATALLGDLLISVTTFFRDAEVFDALKADVLRRWPGGLVEYYGMTEGGGTCILEAHNFPDKLHTVGRPAAGHDIRLIDDNGVEVGPGESGEVVGRSAGMMTGYHGQPERTREAEWFDPQGTRFIRTGDIGRFDADGFLTTRACRRWPWWVFPHRAGARRRWRSWCLTRRQTRSQRTCCCTGRTHDSERPSDWTACGVSLNCRAARSARCSSANCGSGSRQEFRHDPEPTGRWASGV